MSKYITLVEGDLVCNIPKGTTNGEVIQALFPNADYADGRLYMHIINVNTIGEICIPWRWWNAPYKKGGTK